MIQSPPSFPPFDLVAQERIAALFRKCPLAEFIATLETFTPRDRDERAAYEKHYGWALYEAGDYRSAREHLLRALRRSRSGSRDRVMIRGLLGECFLRTGRLESAERCAHRGLSGVPADDGGHYLRAGHLGLLGRVYRRQGHLTHAVETYRRALSLVDEHSSHWAPIVGNLAIALLHQANMHEADAVLRAHKRPLGRSGQEWSHISADVQVALALGDLRRAERALAGASAFYGDRHGERIWMVLTELKAAICRGRREWAQSERLLRPLLDRCESGGRNGDMVACVARGLAESLEGRGRHEEALAPARLAIRAGSSEDRVEWAIALHVLGRCLYALGRREDSRRAFREVVSLHERTEFAAERARLRQTLQRLELADLAATLGDAQERTRERGARAVARIRLADGRVFLTRDATLADQVRAAAASELPALIDGETGTGKDLVARLLHELGPRAQLPFVVVDCRSLPGEISEVLSRADRGTIFLDELPALAPLLQGKLLRVLQEGVRRFGEDATRRVRLRFVAATSGCVDELLKSGALRPDLFYRLNGFRISLAPLRARGDEIEGLAHEIVRRCGLAGVTPAALETLQSSAWPGNVRQLEMTLRVAAAGAPAGGWLDRSHLEARDLAVARAQDESLRDGRIAGERATLLRALEESGGVVTRAARSLGLSRQGFYKALRRTGLASV